MNNITSLSIDLAKNTFQLHGTDKSGKAALKKKISRTKLLEFVANIKPCNIFMEGCSSANYWGRKFIELGHKVKLINPKYVKPYVKRNKNDRNDAAAIAAASRDPDMSFCTVKNEEQQDMQSIHRIRSLLIQQRTGLVNQIRGLSAEYGVIFPEGVSQVRSKLASILSDNPNNMSAMVMHCFMELYERLIFLDKQISFYNTKLKDLFKNNDACQSLAKIPGVGMLSATILVSILGNGGAFKNGRHFAAFLGLTPREHSSGGKERILGISKGGDTYTRSLLIHGARAVVSWTNRKEKTDKRSLWIKKLIGRAGINKASVALANRTARTAWAMIKENSDYNPNHKPIFIKRKIQKVA